MEFLHQQQLNAASFVPSIGNTNGNILESSANNSNTLSFPLNFAQDNIPLRNALSNSQQHLLTTSQMQSQPSQHILLSQQSSTQNIIPKQDNMNSFLHNNMQQIPIETAINRPLDLTSQQSSSIGTSIHQHRTEINNTHHQRTLNSVNNSNNIINYANNVLPYVFVHCTKKND